MTVNELIVTHVGATTLDPALVRGFLQTPPPYRRWGVHRQPNQTCLDQLNATDLFDFYLRLYLSGRHKTLQAVLREVRAFVAGDPTEAPYLINYSLAYTRQHLLTLEWYELLPRLETARLRIVQVAPETDDRLHHSLSNLLSGFD